MKKRQGHQAVELYGWENGDGLFVGPCTENQTGVTIGNCCKNHSQTFIYEIVTTGEDCCIFYGVMFNNDCHEPGKRAEGKRVKWRTACIANKGRIGNNAITLSVNICDQTVIGGCATVTKKITKQGFYAGSLGQFIKPLP